MAALATQISLQTGITPTYNAVSASDTITNDGKTIVEVANGNVASDTVTIVSSATLAGLAVADQTVTVPAGERRTIGPFLTSVFGTTTTITHSVTSSVTMSVIRVNPVM